MDWIERMNGALAYIEANLDGEIDYAEAARLACCSTYHYLKLFSLMCDMPVSEYIRCRRLSMAAADLLGSEDKVIDLAMRYGYESPTAFSRAFQRMHGLSPQAIRRGEGTVKAFPPLSFQIAVKGAVMMEYKMRTIPATRVVGACKRMSLRSEEYEKAIPDFWTEVYKDGTFAKILALCESSKPDAHLPGILGICKMKAPDSMDGMYLIGVATDAPCPPGFEELTLPEATYAAFTSTGPMPHALQDVSRRAVTEWLPTSGYEMTDVPDIEVYSPGDNSAADYHSEVWLPVRKKS